MKNAQRLIKVQNDGLEKLAELGTEATNSLSEKVKCHYREAARRGKSAKTLKQEINTLIATYQKNTPKKASTQSKKR